MNLQNKAKNGSLLKDFHFYSHRGNSWDNVALASDKTFKFYHKDKICNDRKVEEKRQEALKGELGEHNLQKKEMIIGRKIDDLRMQADRKVERFMLQQASKQPIDFKFEPHVEDRADAVKNEEVPLMILKKSGMKSTLAGGGWSKNLWNDFSRMSTKQAKLNFPSTVLVKDEEAAIRIHNKIVNEEHQKRLKEFENNERIVKIREERNANLGPKGGFSRPHTAITGEHTREFSASKNCIQSSRSQKIHSAVTLSENPSSVDRLAAPRSARCTKLSHSEAIPLQNYSEFNGLYVAKLNSLNTQVGTLPYSKVLLTASPLLKQNIQREQSARTNRPQTSVTSSQFRVTVQPGSKLKDPTASWPKPPKEVKYSVVDDLNTESVAKKQIEDFEENFDPHCLDRKRKYYKEYPTLGFDEPVPEYPPPVHERKPFAYMKNGEYKTGSKRISSAIRKQDFVNPIQIADANESTL